MTYDRAAELADQLAGCVTTIQFGDSFELNMERATAMIAAAFAEVARVTREECARIADQDEIIECPFDTTVHRSNDPTIGLTEDDPCPVCHKNAVESLNFCVSLPRARIAAAIRALSGTPSELPPAPALGALARLFKQTWEGAFAGIVGVALDCRLAESFCADGKWQYKLTDLGRQALTLAGK